MGQRPFTSTNVEEEGLLQKNDKKNITDREGLL